MSAHIPFQSKFENEVAYFKFCLHLWIVQRNKITISAKHQNVIMQVSV